MRAQAAPKNVATLSLRSWLNAPRIRLRIQTHPFCVRRGAEVQTEQGERLFERSEFELDPGWIEHRRLPAAQRRDADSRVAFLFLRFLWRDKEK